VRKKQFWQASFTGVYYVNLYYILHCDNYFSNVLAY